MRQKPARGTTAHELRPRRKINRMRSPFPLLQIRLLVPAIGVLVAGMALVSWTTVNEKGEHARLFEMQLGEMLYVEETMAKKLEKMQPMAKSKELQEALSTHQRETVQQAERLRQVFKHVNKEAKATSSAGYDGIMADNEKKMQEFRGTPLLDAVIIAGARTVEHFEMSAYMNLRKTARMMGANEAVMSLIETNLKEEMKTDEKLERLAEAAPAAAPAARDDMRDTDR
jgi:ferritin-like metal-binding protein YciE